jgi:Protein of unknown function (DUF3717)
MSTIPTSLPPSSAVGAVAQSTPSEGIHITDIEAAINYWRARSPSPDGISLCPQLRALAEVYALLVFYHQDKADERSMPRKAYSAWLAWYDSTPDTPCIAICSTSQGDNIGQSWLLQPNVRSGSVSPKTAAPGGLTAMRNVCKNAEPRRQATTQFLKLKCGVEVGTLEKLLLTYVTFITSKFY